MASSRRSAEPRSLDDVLWCACSSLANTLSFTIADARALSSALFGESGEGDAERESGEGDGEREPVRAPTRSSRCVRPCRWLCSWTGVVRVLICDRRPEGEGAMAVGVRFVLR